MSPSTEEHLRDLFAAAAAAAPPATGLADGARRKVRRRRIRIAWASGAVAVAAGAVVATGVLTVVEPARPSTQVQAPAAQEPVSPGPPPDRTAGGPLVDGSEAKCVDGYAPGAIARRAFAFDGTVTAIRSGRSARPGPDRIPLSTVTFHVHRWFKGGTGEVVVVAMTPPHLTGGGLEETVPSYEVGTRLLVAGEPRWGGAPMDDPIAWGCGFTRYYSPETAAGWAGATR